MAEPFTLYKLMILSMLKHSTAPLTNTMLSDFFLEREYASYFSLQAALHELDESQFIYSEKSHNNMLYSITPAGRETLLYFEDKINPEIQAEIRQYISDHQLLIEDETAAVADYYLTSGNKYAVHCELRENGIPQLALTITVRTKEQAAAICENWKRQTDDIYMVLMDHLLK